MKEMILSQAKSQLSEDSCLIGEGIREDLKTRVNILGMVRCYELLQGTEAKKQKEKKTEVKTKGKAKAPIKTEGLDYDEEEEDEEDYVESKGSRVRKGSANSVVSLESIKPKIIKDLKGILRKNAMFGLRANYYARSDLLALGLQKLKKHLEKEKLKTWVVHLFYLIDSHVILNEFLRKHKDSKFFSISYHSTLN